MSPVEIGIIGLLVLFALLVLGLPIGVGMAAVGFAGLFFLMPSVSAMTKLAIVPFETAFSYDLTVLPLFLLMAQICFVSGLSTDLYNLAAKWLGRQPGGLAMATVSASAGFAAMSASSIATAATFGLVAWPEMKRYNYRPELALGSIAAGGTMGVLIPPSSLLILYGIMTESSIGKLFIAGVVPGLIEAFLYLAVIFLLCKWKPSYGPRGPRYSLKEKIMAFRSCGEIILLVFLVLGGLIIGWFTPTEAGAVGAAGACLFCLIRRRLNWQKFVHAVTETLKITGMIYCILIGAFIFQYFMALTTIPFWLSDTVSGLPIPPLLIMVCIIVIYIFLGCIMDTAAMILLTIPIFFPLAVNLGFDPIWFGIILVAVAEIGMITPPIGINVFVISGVVPEVPIQTIYRGILPFLLADVCRVAIYLFIPAVIMFLPNLLM